MILNFIRSIQNEKPKYALFAFGRKFLEQAVGRIVSHLLGWRGGYLGAGSRVIGSKSISMGYKAHINRYAWIEAIHTFRGQTFKPSICIGGWFSAADRLHVSCIDRIEIGDHCLFGSSVYISDHNHGIYKGEEQSWPTQAPVDRVLRSDGPVSIGSNVWLGDNVIIVGPVTIGDGAVVGANSVVTQNVPENVMAAGAPLRMFRRFSSETKTWIPYAG